MQDEQFVSQQERVDQEHLKQLRLFHFIFAGLGILGLIFLLLHYSLMQVFFSQAEQGAAQDPVLAIFMTYAGLFYGFGAITILAHSLLNLLSGIYLKQHRHRTFSFVVAILNCLNAPVGTILGVFTIVVLQRPSVLELYNRQG